MKLRGAFIGIAALLSLGCSGSKRAPAAPQPKPPSTCSLVGTELATFGEVLEATSAEAKPRLVTYAGLLELLLQFEGASTELDGRLAHLKPEEKGLRSSLAAARASLGRATAFAKSERDAIEDQARKIAPLAKETQQAWAALRATCQRGGPECNAVRDVLAHFDAAETSSEHEKVVVELAGLRVSPSVGRARDRAVAASKAVQTAVRARTEQTAAMPKRWSVVQHDLTTSVGALAAACKDDPPGGTELLTAARPDPRKLTVLVHMKPPVGVERSLLALAKATKDREERELYEARAEGAFGSGFFLVLRQPSGPEVLVVTNRHVVELGDRATLSLADGTSLGAADVVFASATHDLAVLKPTNALTVKEGFSLAERPARDQQTVIATGFPGLVGRPSYQTTKGYVSNESFKLDDGQRPLTYVQHTAPIDPGSSGGPLTDEGGHVLGVNTLKVTGREGVGLAVPSRYVVETLRAASAAPARRASSSNRKNEARLACLGFLGELGSADPRLPVLEQMVSNHLVGAIGLDAASALANEEGFDELWSADTVRAMRIASVVQVRAAMVGGGGPSVLETCDDVELGDGDRAKVRVRLGNFESREMQLRWEQGHFKVDGFEGVKPKPIAKKIPVTSPVTRPGKKLAPPRAK